MESDEDFLAEMLKLNPDERNKSFAQSLDRLRGKEPLVGEDRQVISLLPDYRHARNAFTLPTRHAQVPQSKMEFLTKGNITEHGYSSPFPIFSDGKEGLTSLGWSKLSHGDVQLGEGSYGTVQLVFKLEDVDEDPEKRRLAAFKSQVLEDARVQRIWTELTILKSVRHSNIVDYYGAFVYGTEYQKQVDHVNRLHTDHMYAATSPPVLPQVSRHELWILIEYATAGDLNVEIGRYVDRMPELGALFYMKQIMSGLEHLHKKRIIHNDLHSSNILLSYNRDGISKRCMICDFGLSVIIGITEDASLEEMAGQIQDDIANLIEEIMRDMLFGFPSRARVVSAAIDEVLNNVLEIRNIAHMRSFAWFSEQAVAPRLGQGSGHVPLTARLTPEPHRARTSLHQERDIPHASGVHIHQRSRSRSPHKVRHAQLVPSASAPSVHGARTSPPHAVVQRVELENPQYEPHAMHGSLPHPTPQESNLPSPHRTGQSTPQAARSRHKSSSPK